MWRSRWSRWRSKWRSSGVGGGAGGAGGGASGGAGGAGGGAEKLLQITLTPALHGSKGLIMSLVAPNYIRVQFYRDSFTYSYLKLALSFPTFLMD